MFIVQPLLPHSLREVIILHEFDKCVVSTVGGAKLAEGSVTEFGETYIRACLDDGFNFAPAQDVTVFIFNRVKGECVYRGKAAKVEGQNVLFDHVTFVRATQKRDNTRVSKTLRYRITHRFTEEGLEKLDSPIEILILNLSAQGMYISCAEDFSVGQRFPLVFKDAGRPIDLDVEVIRCEKTARSKRYGCRFRNISEKDADNIYRFVLHEQIEQRRKNLLI